MLHLKKSYYEDLRFFDETYKRVLAVLLIVGLILLPFIFGNYLLYMFSLIFVYLVITMGLNILIGNAGQLSLGHAAFVAIGAYATAIISTRFPGIPFVGVMLIAGFIAVIMSVIVGLPSLRLKFLYLALATMAFEFIIEEVIMQWRTLTNGDDGMAVPRAEFFGFIFDSDIKVYYLILGTSLLMILLAKNIMRSNIGRAFEAIRDSDIAAPVMGINMGRYKLLAFGIGGFYAGIGGALFGYLMRFIGPANFTIHDTIAYLVIILVGGMGSILGSIIGAIFLTLLPEGIRFMKDLLPSILGEEKNLHTMVYGLILIAVILFEPQGLAGRWIKIKTYFELFPLGKKPKRKQIVVSGARKV